MTAKGKRRVSCDDMGWDDEFKKGAWTAEEDSVLRTAVYVRLVLRPSICAPTAQALLSTATNSASRRTV